jgi:hypothetical protein
MPNDGTLLKEKLYAHQAIQDSVIMKDEKFVIKYTN